MKFNINNYKGSYVMHCKTKEEAESFCRYLDSVNRKWGSGKSYLFGTNWECNQSNTVYYFNHGTYGDLRFINKNEDGITDYTILEWSDFMQFTKADLRTGDVVQLRDGELGIVLTDFEVIVCQNGGWLDFKYIREDLTDSFYGGKCDIIIVRRPRQNYECAFDAIHHDRGIIVYERKEPEEMTLAEVCKLLGREIKIVK